MTPCVEHVERDLYKMYISAAAFGPPVPCGAAAAGRTFPLAGIPRRRNDREEHTMATEGAVAAGAPATGRVENKGLKSDAIGFISNVVIATASVAPAYSL